MEVEQPTCLQTIDIDLGMSNEKNTKHPFMSLIECERVIKELRETLRCTQLLKAFGHNTQCPLPDGHIYPYDGYNEYPFI